MHVREIRAKIASTASIRKTTRAMELMARTQMAGAQKRARDFRPYAAKVREMAERMVRDRPDYVSPLVVQRTPVRRVGLIVVSTDRGLCGPLNSRLLIRCLDRLEQWHRDGVRFELSVIGSRGIAPLSRYGAQIGAHASGRAGEQHFDALLGAMLAPITAFMSGELDEVYVAFNQLESALKYEPRIDKILPITGFDQGISASVTEPSEEAGQGASSSINETAPPRDAPPSSGAYLYEPEPQPVVDTLLLRHVEAMLYQAVIENHACEQCARMFSMQAATDNADRMLRDLEHQYHTIRQAQITTELCEIVAGAAAI